MTILMVKPRSPGGDVNAELLEKARNENLRLEKDVKFMPLDFDRPFGVPDNYFDLVSCCFAIYYAADIPFTNDLGHHQFAFLLNTAIGNSLDLAHNAVEIIFVLEE